MPGTEVATSLSWRILAPLALQNRDSPITPPRASPDPPDLQVGAAPMATATLRSPASPAAGSPAPAPRSPQSGTSARDPPGRRSLDLHRESARACARPIA